MLILSSYRHQSLLPVRTCPFPPPAGIPRTPDTPTGVSNTPGSVVLTLSTRESGTTPPQMFSFVVNITLTFDGSRFSRILEANDYMDNEERQFTIDGLLAGEFYLFSAQAQNQFGTSDFTNSDPIRGRFQCVGVWVCGCLCVGVGVWVWVWVCGCGMNSLIIIPSYSSLQWLEPLLPPPQCHPSLHRDSKVCAGSRYSKLPHSKQGLLEYPLNSPTSVGTDLSTLLPV